MGERVTDRKIILVKRKTRLENLIVRYNTVQQAKFYIEHSGSDFSDYLQEDIQYKSVVEYIVSEIKNLGIIHILDREFLPNFLFGKEDIVVVTGQDGLVANTLKYLENQPLIGVNPDPARWDGILLPFKTRGIKKIVLEVLNNKRQYKETTLAQVDLADGQKLYAVNDLFIGQKTHTSSRYTIEHSGISEQQSSSGIIVSTGLGSTGWFKSIIEGASNITRSYLNYSEELKETNTFKWGSNFLYYAVREPYPSNSTSTNLTFGKIDKHNTFKVSSQMPEGGVIFSDGIENDYLEFNSGTNATVKIADKKGLLVI